MVNINNGEYLFTNTLSAFYRAAHNVGFVHEFIENNYGHMLQLHKAFMNEGNEIDFAHYVRDGHPFYRSDYRAN